MDVENFKETLCIFSFNSRGFAEDKQNICKTLCIESTEYHTILCNQENFLLKDNCYKVKQCLPNSLIFPKPAVKDSLDGRPKNGMFIAVPAELKNMVEDVSPTHWRVQAIMIRASGNNLLVINSYFPTDPRLLRNLTLLI